MRCRSCDYALWDYETFSNSPDKQWFVCGCQLGIEESEDDKYQECEHFKEIKIERNY